MASQRKKVVRDWEASRNRILRQGLGGYSAPGEQFESSMEKYHLFTGVSSHSLSTTLTYTLTEYK